MTRHHVSPGSRHSKGFSLIELMVSLTIGLVIAVAAVSAYLGTSGASRMAEAQSRMNEDAQAALTILTQQLRMAGNNPKQANRVDNAISTFSSYRNPVYLPTPTFAGFSLSPTTFKLSSFQFIRGCDGQFSNVTTAPNIDSLTCAGSPTTLPDSIAINYEADKFNTVPTSGGAPTDCLGSALDTITATLPTVVGASTSTTAVTYTVADNRFYIDTSTAAIPSLYCKGNGKGGASTTQPLVENIEDMQFTYGTLSTSPGTTTATVAVAGYLRADQIISEPSLALLANDAEQWGHVVTVHICVLVRSENPVASDLASARYIKCDGTLETAPADLRLRRAYSTTVGLQN
ncbi:MAG TPA: PilW family protein [Rhodoferax sp.]